MLKLRHELAFELKSERVVIETFVSRAEEDEEEVYDVSITFKIGRV